ncbi:hypothetical protein C8J56DRAFT_862868 [Mycena floridula]|nr:hypothetical protein C8J56DRAFT_862868 [Mycena floridula]
MSAIITPMSPATTHLIRAPSVDATTNAVDDFFGQASSSRHDRRLSDQVSVEAPPPYLAPPEYTRKAEPATLAMYLFKFGFLFPPFWILGAIILLSPLRAPADEPDLEWLPEKTDAERQAVIQHLRKAELKWAWRCLLALVALVAFGFAAGISIWAILHSHWRS